MHPSQLVALFVSQLSFTARPPQANSNRLVAQAACRSMPMSMPILRKASAHPPVQATSPAILAAMTSNIRRVGILALPWPIPPTRYGGVEIAMDGLCRGLSEAGIEVFLWSHPDSTCPVRRGSTDIRVRVDETWHSVTVELQHVLAGYRWLAENDVDIVHDITLAGPLVGPTLVDVPVVTTNFLPFTPPTPAQTFPDVSMLYEELGRRIPVIAVSQGQARRAVSPVAEVIPLATELDTVLPGPGDGDQHGEYLLFLGRMAPEKGVAAAIAAARQAGVRLKIAARMAEPAEREYFRSYVQPLLADGSVEYVGEPTVAEKTELLRHAVALVNPITWEEPFGLVMIEAMAAGTPVIARRGGAVSEIVATDAVGAVCDSQDDVVAAIRARSTFSREACRARVEEHFSYPVMTARHLAFYESVIEKYDR
jgi:glycosyltransferase involved in cell wall biosynthesis